MPRRSHSAGQACTGTRRLRCRSWSSGPACGRPDRTGGRSGEAESRGTKRPAGRMPRGWRSRCCQGPVIVGPCLNVHGGSRRSATGRAPSRQEVAKQVVRARLGGGVPSPTTFGSDPEIGHPRPRTNQEGAAHAAAQAVRADPDGADPADPLRHDEPLVDRPVPPSRTPSRSIWCCSTRRRRCRCGTRLA